MPYNSSAYFVAGLLLDRRRCRSPLAFCTSYSQCLGHHCCARGRRPSIICGPEKADERGPGKPEPGRDGTMTSNASAEFTVERGPVSASRVFTFYQPERPLPSRG